MKSKKQTHRPEKKVILLIDDLCEVSARLTRVLSEANVRLKEKGIVGCNVCMTEAEHYKKYLKTVRILEMMVNGVFEKEQIRKLDSLQNKISKTFDVYVLTDIQKQTNNIFKQTQCCGLLNRNTARCIDKNKKFEHNLKCFLIKLQQTVGDLILQICFLKSRTDLFSKSEQLKIFNIPMMNLKILNFEYTNLTDKIIYLINFEKRSIESDGKKIFDGYCILCAKEELSCLLDSLDVILRCTKPIKLLPKERNDNSDKLSVCCHRCDPHIHGEINGNLVVLKFNQPQGKIDSGDQTSEVDKSAHELNDFAEKESHSQILTSVEINGPKNKFELQSVLKKDNSCNTSETLFQRGSIEKSKDSKDNENKLPTIINDGEKIIEPTKNGQQISKEGNENSEKEEETSSDRNYSEKKFSDKEIGKKLIKPEPELSNYSGLNKLLLPVPSSPTLPYVISLQSLPLTEDDIKYLAEKTKMKSVEQDKTNNNNKQNNILNISENHTSNEQVYNIFDKATGPFIPSLSSLILNSDNLQTIRNNQNEDGFVRHNVEIRYFLLENDRKFFSFLPIHLTAAPPQTTFPFSCNSNVDINPTFKAGLNETNESYYDLLSSESSISETTNSALELQKQNISNINHLDNVASVSYKQVKNVKSRKRRCVISSKQGISEILSLKKFQSHNNLQLSNGDTQTKQNICLKSFISCFVKNIKSFDFLKRRNNVIINRKRTENNLNRYKNISRSNANTNLIKLPANAASWAISNITGVGKIPPEDINIFDYELNKTLSVLSFVVNKEVCKLKINGKENNLETKKKLVILKFIKQQILEQMDLSGKAKKIITQICYNTINSIEEKLNPNNLHLSLESSIKDVAKSETLLKHCDNVNNHSNDFEDLCSLVLKTNRDHRKLKSFQKVRRVVYKTKVTKMLKLRSKLQNLNRRDKFLKVFTSSRKGHFKVLLSLRMKSKKHKACIYKKSYNSKAMCTFKKPVTNMRSNVFLKLPEIKYNFCSFIPKFQIILIKHDVYLNTDIQRYEPNFFKIHFKVVDLIHVHFIFQKALLTLVKEALILKVGEIIETKHKNIYQIIRKYPNRNTVFKSSWRTNLARIRFDHSLKQINTHKKKSSNVKLGKYHNNIPKLSCHPDSCKGVSVRNNSHLKLHDFKGYKHDLFHFNKLEQQIYKQHGNKRSKVYILNKKQIKFYNFWREPSISRKIPWE